MTYKILRGDCIAIMRAMPDNSTDSIVTDPPYELGFMGRAWDASGIAYSVEMWREALRVLKPGGHLLAFSGSRTYHRMTCAIEDAGFEVRDQIMWVYGSGFPKSLDVSKAMDKVRDDRAEGKALGAWLKAQREARGIKQKDVAALWPSVTGGITGCVANWETIGNVPKWDQWLALKSFIGFGDEMDAEVWRLNGRKGTPGEAWNDREVVGQQKGLDTRITRPGIPLQERSSKVYDLTAPASEAARQWEGWGTALKPAHEPICVARKPLIGTVAANVLAHGTGAINIDGCRVGDELISAHGGGKNAEGRKYGNGQGIPAIAAGSNPHIGRWPANFIHDGLPEEWARFFYCPKASKADRGEGNTHPTVKPLALMQYLCRLVTPPGGHVLDPFAGSGSTLVAGLREGFTVTGIELHDDHAAIIEARVENELYGDFL
jgi:DNA modification methylase